MTCSASPILLGWIYQYWNTEEKDRVFEAAARGRKIEGADIIPATCIYTEDYMVRFLVENSLRALWVEMHPGFSQLPDTVGSTSSEMPSGTHVSHGR